MLKIKLNSYFFIMVLVDRRPKVHQLVEAIGIDIQLTNFLSMRKLFEKLCAAFAHNLPVGVTFWQNWRSISCCSTAITTKSCTITVYETLIHLNTPEKNQQTKHSISFSESAPRRSRWVCLPTKSLQEFLGINAI